MTFKYFDVRLMFPGFAELPHHWVLLLVREAEKQKWTV